MFEKSPAGGGSLIKKEAVIGADPEIAVRSEFYEFDIANIGIHELQQRPDASLPDLHVARAVGDDRLVIDADIERPDVVGSFGWVPHRCGSVIPLPQSSHSERIS